MELPQLKSSKEVNELPSLTQASFPLEKKLSEAHKFITEVSVSLEAEIPEELYNGMKDFIGTNPQWDQYRLMSSALANFLFQNGSQDRAVTERYLNDLFNLADS